VGNVGEWTRREINRPQSTTILFLGVHNEPYKAKRFFERRAHSPGVQGFLIEAEKGLPKRIKIPAE